MKHFTLILLTCISLASNAQEESKVEVKHYYYNYVDYSENCSNEINRKKAKHPSRIDMINETLTIEVKDTLLLRAEIYDTYEEEDIFFIEGVVGISNVKNTRGLPFLMGIGVEEIIILISDCIKIKLH